MKIAISHTRYSFVGGVEKYIYSLVERLLDAGHEVHYFCHFWEKDADPRIRFHRVPNPFKAFRFMKVWSFDRWSQWQIANEDFDVVADADDSFASIAHLLTPSQDAIGRETADALREALDALSEEHREVITLARLVKLPHRVIGEVMSRSEEATRQLLARAMVQLVRELARRGVDVEQWSAP